MLVMLPLLALLGYSIWSGYQDAIRLATTTSRNLAATLESRLGATLRRADGDLQDFLSMIPSDALHGDAVPRYAQTVEARLDAHLASFPELIGFGVFDTGGRLLYASGRHTGQPQPSAEGGYFKALIEGSVIGIAFSDVMKDPQSGRKYVVAARAVEDSSSVVRGVVAASLDMDFLERSFGELDLGTQGTVGVYHRHAFTRIARWPPLDIAQNRVLPPASPTRAALAGGESAATVDSKVTADGIRRISSSHVFTQYPFFVVVGIAYDGALAAWRRRSLATSAAVLAFLALLAGLMRRLARNEMARNRYAAIVENSNDAILSRTLDGTILTWNAGAERMLGYSALEAVGKPILFYMPPGRTDFVADNNAAILRGEVVIRESHCVTRDGRPLDVLTSLSPIRDGSGRIVAVSLILQDITARKLAQAQAKFNEERTQGIVDSALDPIISLDGGQRIVVFNPAAEKLFGYRAADLIGKPLDPLIPERFRVVHRKHIENFGATGVSTRGREGLGQLYGLRADGTEFPIEASISQTGSGEQKLFTVILRDTSARMQAAATRASLEAQLRESQKMEAIGTLAGGIAHDFNNALATILGNAELARQDVSGNAPALESLEEIRKAGTRARNLVQQILSFSRRQPTERKCMDPAPTVQEAARLLRATLPARLMLQVDCVPGVPQVMADASQLEQVLINLATNAMQAIPTGPGKVTIRLDSVTLGARDAAIHPVLNAMVERSSQPVVRISVSDTGCGMDAATRARIFDPFFTTKPKGEGTGLGLSVVHGIVQTHEGAITVDSAPGKGTTFSVYLPRAQAAGASPGAEVTPVALAVPRANGARVLYIDDNEALVGLVQRVLQRRGFQVDAYTDQHAALQALRANPAAFDVVLTDYNMPGMSGLDVACEVHAIRADLPVAVISGFIDDELRAKAASAGITELIFKADNVSVIINAVERMAQAEPDRAVGG